MEITQFTYFQQVGGLECHPTPIEITYGVERLAMYIQNKQSVFDIVFSENNGKIVSYADVHKRGEYEFSKYHFEVADTNMLFLLFDKFKAEAKSALNANLPLPAYDCVMYCSHFFNVLDARGAISVTQRQDYILQIREIAKECAVMYKGQS